MALLEVDDLHVSFRTSDGIVQAVRGVSFDVDAGQIPRHRRGVRLRKRVSTQTIMGLTRGARISGRAMFEGRDLLTLPLPELRKIRGSRDRHDLPGPAVQPLHPYDYKVGWQIVEMIRQHDHDMFRYSEAWPGPWNCSNWSASPSADRRVDRLPASVLGRYAPARDDCHGHRPATRQAAHRRRADHRAGRHRFRPRCSRSSDPARKRFGTAVILITHDLGVVAPTWRTTLQVACTAGAVKAGPAHHLLRHTTTPTPRACCYRCRTLPEAVSASGSGPSTASRPA